MKNKNRLKMFVNLCHTFNRILGLKKGKIEIHKVAKKINVVKI